MPRAFAFALLALSVPLSGSKVVELRLLARSARYVPFFDKFVLHLLPPWPVPGHFYPLFSGDCRQLSLDVNRCVVLVGVSGHYALRGGRGLAVPSTTPGFSTASRPSPGSHA